MLEINNVSMTFGDKKALEDINLTVKSGTALGLVGANGAGKSTIMRLMCGMYKPTAGKVTLDGEDIYNNPDAKRRIFFVCDETVQYNSFTIERMKDFYLRYYKNFSVDVYRRLLDALSLPEDKRLDTFSKGMKRQAAVIIALSCCTDYLVLDEAFDGIDPVMQNIVRDMLIDAMLDRGMTVILSSHNMGQINTLCDSISLIHSGRMIFSHRTEDFSENLHKISFASDIKIHAEDISTLGIELLHIEESGSTVCAVVRGNVDELRQKLEGIMSAVTDILPLTLEEVFLYETEVKGYGQNKKQH